MTRDEFLEISEWADLVDFCYENNLYMCDDVYDDGQKDEWINDRLYDWARELNWRELYDRLNEIPDSSDWYILDDYGDFCEAGDEEFEEYKENILEAADENGLFDDEEEEYEEDSLEDYTLDEDETEEEEFVPEMPFDTLYRQSPNTQEDKNEEFTLKSLF